MGDALIGSDKVLYFDANRYTKRSFTIRREPTSSALPEFHLNFYLSYKAYVSYWVLTEDSSDPQLEERFRLPTIKKLVRLNLEQFLSKKRAWELLYKEMKKWRVWPRGRRNFIDLALEKAWEKMESMPLSHNVVNLYFGMVMTFKYIYGKVGMIPALQSSIESLEHMTLTEGGSCQICLEEFVNGGKGVSMPCSHIFHGDCIKKWLDSSHYCPLCRFKMPTR